MVFLSFFLQTVQIYKGCSLKFSPENTANHKFNGTRKSVGECKKYT